MKTNTNLLKQSVAMEESEQSGPCSLRHTIDR